jgi:soluble lytic murein transglycosylase
MRLGSTYLGELISSFSGSYVLAVAGYNAGPGRANQWMGFCGDPRAASVDPVDYIECIPFSETRNYVMRVMEAVAVYRAKLRGGLTTLDLGRDIRRGVYTPRPSTTAPATPANAGAGPGQTPEETPP